MSSQIVTSGTQNAERRSPKGEAAERYLAFTLGSETYAVPLLTVREVIAETEITRVPGLPAHVQGILNLRGEIISIVDLKARFRLRQGSAAQPANAVNGIGATNEQAIMILEVGRFQLGAIVDSVDSVLALQESQISPLREFSGDSKGAMLSSGELVSSVARTEKGLIALLNVERCFGIGQGDRNESYEKNPVTSAA